MYLITGPPRLGSLRARPPTWCSPRGASPRGKGAGVHDYRVPSVLWTVLTLESEANARQPTPEAVLCVPRWPARPILTTPELP